MELFNEVFSDHLGQTFKIKTLKELQENCAKHNINLYTKFSSIYESSSSTFWILYHEETSETSQCLAAFFDDKIVNYLPPSSDLKYKSPLFAADRQGTRPHHREFPELFQDKISERAVEHLVEAACEKLEYVHCICKSVNN